MTELITLPQTQPTSSNSDMEEILQMMQELSPHIEGSKLFFIIPGASPLIVADDSRQLRAFLYAKAFEHLKRPFKASSIADAIEIIYGQQLRKISERQMPVPPFILAVINHIKDKEFLETNVTDLMARCSAIAEDLDDYPRSPIQASRLLTKYTNHLRLHGVDFKKLERRSSSRPIRLELIDERVPDSSMTSADIEVTGNDRAELMLSFNSPQNDNDDYI